MSQTNLSTNRVRSEYQSGSGGAVSRNYPVIGIVKNNIDPTKSGRVQVSLNDFGQSDPDDSDNWITLSYMSPFFGSTQGGSSTKNRDNFGNFVDTQQSYGFWATPPDIGTMVLCVFANGDINQGYYIGCIPTPGSTQMTPGLGARSKVVMGSDVEAEGYGGVARLPTTEVNYNNPEVLQSDNFDDDARPVHSFLAATYHRQGLTRDPVRGPVSSSANRESPSQVFGMSTPGRPIFEGGLDDEDLTDTGEQPDDKLKVTGRRGGHSFVMDDGDQTGKDQIVRLRTALGHQILMSDSEQLILVAHSNGKTWIELGRHGTIDIFGEDSCSIRVKGDLNLRADKNLNIDTGETLQFTAKKIKIQTDDSIKVKAGQDINIDTSAKLTAKADQINFGASGIGSFSSGSDFYINGSKIRLNSGKVPSPPTVDVLKQQVHPESVFGATKGFVEAPGVLSSYCSRVPSHLPWTGANAGTNDSPNVTAESNKPEQSEVTNSFLGK